ncbi:MAG TPA: alkaline shock response membrane anchor protein AmaP [Candidatus Olsenella avistercoris]|nr:alkaline shock response membrane anchor protein AmaP [Candidatus Olsenella avistercoris]
MSVFKRLCAIVFVLADLAALAALALTWYGPWTSAASALFAVGEYSLAVVACLAISAFGLLVLLLRALFSRRTVRTVEIATVDGGVISVTRDAIAAQASHIVEADGTCAAARVRVDAKARGHVRVHVRVLPHETVDVVAKGAELHEELIDGLAAVCGDKVEDVSLEFVEPESVTLAAAPEDDAGAEAEAAPAPAGTPDSTSEITVSMGPARDAEREA